MNKKYKFWIENAPKNVVDEISKYSEKEITECFGDDIKFGTAGIREIMKWGTSTLNEYTLSKFAYAYGRALLIKYGATAKKEGIVIAHDNRRNGEKYTLLVAGIISALEIPVYLFSDNELQPTPLLSYVVSKGNYVGGLNITASHNPPEFSGMKLYGDNGAQLCETTTTIIESILLDVKNIFEIEKNSKLIQYLSPSIIEQYVNELIKMIPFYHGLDTSSLKIVYTPQHGTATKIAEKIFKKMNTTHWFVKEQSFPDSEFVNTKSPNPENPIAFELAEKYGKKHKADLLFSTDPDADRFGIAVRNKDNTYTYLNGNELSCIQIYYKLKELKKINYLKKGDFIVGSVVSTRLAEEISSSFDVDYFTSLTGFKSIYEKVNKHEAGGHECLFAWEESFGSIIRTMTKDKDSFQSLIQVIEMATLLKKENKSILDLLEEIYEKYTYYESFSIKIDLRENKSLAEKKINEYRKFEIGQKIGNFVISNKVDYMDGHKDFGKTNMIFLYFEKDQFSVAIRKSGTEPILKIYFDLKSKNKKELIDIKREFLELFNK